MKYREMNLIQHLEELRKRIIRTLITFLVSLVVSFIFVRDIYRWLINGLEDKLVILGPSEVVWIYFMISGVIAIAITLPMVAYQTWQFIKPALTSKEHKSTLSFIPAIAVLFLLGIAFGYFVLFPIILQFMEEIAEKDFQTMYTAEKYFTFMLHITLPFGLLFEMPAIVLFLTRLGILSPKKLVQSRKIAYFILVIVSVIVTPPDILSDILVIVPLLLLYEISISISKFAERKWPRMKEQSQSQYGRYL